MTNNYISLPAAEVRRRAQECINWYEQGGRTRVQELLTINQRNEYRKELEGARTGLRRQPISEEEIESRVEEAMRFGTSSFPGTSLVAMRLVTYDGYIREMRELVGAATGDNEMMIRTFLWNMIVAHSTEPHNEPAR